MRTVIFGPFIGEFGWELCYWHGWIRKFSKQFNNSKIVVSSFKRSYPLYQDFVDEFVPISDELNDKKYSLSGYFPDFGILNNEQVLDFLKIYNQEINKLKKMFRNDNEELIHIPIYPQRNRKHLSHLLFLFKKILKLDRESAIEKQNPFKGLLIKNYISFLSSCHKDSWDVQTPPNNFQYVSSLKSSKEADQLSEKLIKQITHKEFVTIFPRKRDLRRPDKNWSEQNWIEFIKMIIDDLKLGVFICGTPEGTFLHNFTYNNLVNTIFEKPSILLDLQISLLNKSNYSIHGRSGSCYLSMQAGNKTFMAGPESDRYRICEYDNINNAEIFYFTDYGVNPSPKQKFDAFKNYYLKTND